MDAPLSGPWVERMKLLSYCISEKGEVHLESWSGR